MNKNLLKTKFKINNINELIDLFLATNYKYKSVLSKTSTEISLRILRDLKVIDLDEINDYMYNNLKWNDSSKRTKMAHISCFLKWLSDVKKIYINTKHLMKYKPIPSKKEEYTIEELKILQDTILNAMKNEVFYVYFELLVWNGCRLGELFLVNWEEAKNQNYSAQIMALKNGNSRTIDIPQNLIEFFEKGIKLDVKYQTVKNWFQNLQKIIKKKYSWWYKPISSHCPRVHRATYAYLNGMSSTEISVMYGAKNFHTFQGTYIKGKAINKTLIYKANQNPIHIMNEYDKDQEIQKLRKIIEIQKNYISQIGNNENKFFNYEQEINKWKIILIFQILFLFKFNLDSHKFLLNQNKKNNFKN